MSQGTHNRAAVHVVAGALIDEAGRVLIAQRPAGKHLAGGWEFPGGKLEIGEARLSGLARELREELGITLEAARPLMRLHHAYPDRDVLLDVWVVTRYRGAPKGLDGQRLRWCSRDELADVELLPADRPIVVALRLPERLTEIAARNYAVGALGLMPEARSAADARVMGEARAAGAVGDRRPVDDAQEDKRPSGAFYAAVQEVDNRRLRGVFCTGSQEAAAAAAVGAEFLVLRETLDAAALAGLCESVNVPVFARGIALEEAWDLGAIGVNEINA